MDYNRQDAIYCLKMAVQWAGSYNEIPNNTEAVAWFNTYLRIACNLNNQKPHFLPKPTKVDDEALEKYNKIINQIKAIENAIHSWKLSAKLEADKQVYSLLQSKK